MYTDKQLRRKRQVARLNNRFNEFINSSKEVAVIWPQVFAVGVLVGALIGWAGHLFI